MYLPVYLSPISQFLTNHTEHWFVSKGLPIAFILLGGLVVQQVLRFISRRLRHTVQHQAEGTASGRAARAQTLTSVFMTSASAVSWFIVGLMILDKLNVNIAPLLTGAGVMGFAIGFGSQELVKDMISGFFFLYENQFNVGDIIQVRDKKGQVRDMNLRTVRLRGEDGESIIMRNSQIDVVTKLPKSKPSDESPPSPTPTPEKS